MKLQRIDGSVIIERDGLIKDVCEYCAANNISLDRANLYRARLEHADLRDVDLECSNLKGAHLKGANLEGADLEGADLGRTNLKGANLKDADLDFSCLSLCCNSQFVADVKICKQIEAHSERIIDLSKISHSDVCMTEEEFENFRRLQKQFISGWHREEEFETHKPEINQVNTSECQE